MNFSFPYNVQLLSLGFPQLIYKLNINLKLTLYTKLDPKQTMPATGTVFASWSSVVLASRGSSQGSWWPVGTVPNDLFADMKINSVAKMPSGTFQATGAAGRV